MAIVSQVRVLRFTSLRGFDQEVPLEAASWTVERGDLLVTVLPVKIGRLEIEAVQAHAGAAASKRSLLRPSQERVLGVS
jgi:hypothetical protein